MFEKIPHELQQFAIGIAGLVPFATIARIIIRHQLVHQGYRTRFFSWDLLWELPVMVFCILIALGLSEYIGAGRQTEIALVVAVSWVGPRGLEIMLARWAVSELEKEKKQ